MPHDERGTDWTAELFRSDTSREWWRKIVWESRDHYFGMRRGDTTATLVSPYNKHRSVEDFLKASLEPAGLSYRLSPTESAYQRNARVCQATLNHAMRRMSFPRRIGAYLTYGRVDGVAIAKTEVGLGGGWTPSVEGDAGAQKAVPGAPTDRHTSAALRTEDQLRALRRAFITQSDLPECEPLDPINFLLAPGSVIPEHAPWYAHAVDLAPARVRELVKSGYYRDVPLNYDAGLPSMRERLERERQMAGVQPGLRKPIKRKGKTTGPDENDPWTRWQIWEIHDRVEDRIYHVLPGTDQLLRDVPREIEGEPYTIWRPSGTEYEFWAIPDVRQYMMAQRALDRMLDLIIQHVARHAKTVILTTSNVPEATKTAVARAANGEFITVQDLAAIQPLMLGQLPPDVFRVLGLLSQVIHEVAGVSPLSTGIPTQPGASATEVVTLQANTNVRLARMQRLLIQAFEHIGRRTLNLLGKFAPPEQIVPILGHDIALWEQWKAGDSIRVEPKDLTGEYEFEVVLGQGNTVDPMRQKLAVDKWNIFSPSPWFDTHLLATGVAAETNMDPKVVRSPEDVARMMAEQQAAAMEAAAGPSVGREPKGAAKAPEAEAVSKDQRRRTGEPEVQSQATDAMRGGASR